MDMLTPGRLYPPLPVRWWTLAIDHDSGSRIYPAGTFVRPASVKGHWLTCRTYGKPPAGVPTPRDKAPIWVSSMPLDEAFLGPASARLHRGLLQEISSDGLALVTETCTPEPCGPHTSTVIPSWPIPLARVPIEIFFPDLGDVEPDEVPVGPPLPPTSASGNPLCTPLHTDLADGWPCTICGQKPKENAP